MQSTTREELKYLISHLTRQFMLARCGMYLVRDQHAGQDGVYPVLSQYYDSPTLSFYNDKIEGFGVRNKVRIRTYDLSFDGRAPVYLELKQRVDDGILKTRERVANPAQALADPSTWGATTSSTFGYLAERRQLRPSAGVFYFREAYRGASDRDLRVTFDTNVIAVAPGQRLSRETVNDAEELLLPDNHVILEIKAKGDIPAWVRRVIVDLELARRTLSKYVMAADRLRLADTCTSGVWA
ncbi:MAG: polyphosphate polymerase domain-containing protein [Planctomycetaceae bacterium]|nr:polyphosphate polymerase domain-containing protein [Planctomycetaceae bacterium]